MQRSSESVAALATALAKAQGELVNPEKSLTATIRAACPEGTQHSFRYAPLSAGLDIVRKTLGQHEIATVQTTAIDQAAGLVNLTTVLAHASGEWIASDWPVCPIADIASPHRMGAALTYARRYALFTLVGIAGEDDLDAPDIAGCGPAAGSELGSSQDQSLGSHRHSGNGRLRSATKTKPHVVLDPAASAELREKLVAEVETLTSADCVVSWATRTLRAKNSLIATDAKLLESAFEQKLSGLSSAAQTDVSAGKIAAAPSSQEEARASSVGSDQPRSIDKSLLAIAAPRRYRNREHLRYVAQQACLVCGRRPTDPHHLRHVQPRALGRKASDEFAVPLCRVHHRAVHRARDERAWWQTTGIDPLKVARKLWKQTRMNEGQIRVHRMAQATATSDKALKSSAAGNKAPT
jgi:ERF superfamily